MVSVFSGSLNNFLLYFFKRCVLKSLVMFSYDQPVDGSKFRWGVLQSKRDTKKNPLNPETINGNYRKWDSAFKRSRNIEYVQTRDGVKAFYKERKRWGIKVPFVGSLVEGMIKD